MLRRYVRRFLLVNPPKVFSSLPGRIDSLDYGRGLTGRELCCSLKKGARFRVGFFIVLEQFSWLLPRSMDAVVRRLLLPTRFFHQREFLRSSAQAFSARGSP